MKFSAKHGGRLIWKSYSPKQTRQQAFQLSGIFHGANQKFPFYRGPVCQVIRNIILLLNVLVHFFVVDQVLCCLENVNPGGCFFKFLFRIYRCVLDSVS